MAYKMEQGVVTSHWHYDNLWGFKKVTFVTWCAETPLACCHTWHAGERKRLIWYTPCKCRMIKSIVKLRWCLDFLIWSLVFTLRSMMMFWKDLTHHYNLKENHQIGLFMSIQAVYSCLFALIVEIKSNCDKGISQCPPLSEVWSNNNKGGLKQGKRRG